MNNSAGYIASNLYGGQLNKCELYVRTNYSMIDGNRKYIYSDYVLERFMNMPKIIQYNESDSLTKLISLLKLIKLNFVVI